METTDYRQILGAFGDRIRRLRTEKGLSQEAFADLVGLHRTYVGGVERGERNLSLENIAKIASAFRMSLSDLFEGIA